MGQENKSFQYIVTAIFMGLAVIAVIVFAMYRASTGGVGASSITLWGTIDSTAMSSVFSQMQQKNPSLKNVTYRQLSPYAYNEELTQAFAEGRGPDLYLIDQSQLLSEFPKLTPISYKTLPERTFRDIFFDGADLFLFGNGVMGLPLAADPLVLYWNKDIFADTGLVAPPKYWDEFFVLAPKLTKRTDDGKITRSAVAMGSYDNVTHAKEILSALIFAAGSPIVKWGSGGLTAVLSSVSGVNGNPGEAALRFFTEFSNPIKTAYSWHKSMPNAKDAFLSGQLAMYIGYASEASDLRNANPNLNFDITLLPQSRLASRRTTYARIYALVIPKTSKDPTHAYQAALTLTGTEGSGAISHALGFAPVRRDLLTAQQTTAYWSTVYQSAIIAKSWLEPNVRGVNTAFARMVDEVTSGRGNAASAIGTAQQELSHLIQ
jgi:multiple sugar transport system substrate-binding protein